MAKTTNKLIAKAKQNVSTTKSIARKVVSKELGVPLEHKEKHNPSINNPQTVGVNFGVTLNMDNFESVRIDCWLTDSVQEGETYEQAFQRVFNIAEGQVNETSQKYRE